MDVRVFNLTTEQVGTLRHVVDIGIGTRPRGVRGMELLVHVWLVLFLSSVDTDPIDPDSGGDVLSMVGQNNNFENIGDLTSRVQKSVEKVNLEVIQDQIEEDIDDPDELLATGILEKVEADDEDGVEISVHLISQSGLSAQLILPVV